VDSVTGEVVESHEKGRGYEVGDNRFRSQRRSCKRLVRRNHLHLWHKYWRLIARLCPACNMLMKIPSFLLSVFTFTYGAFQEGIQYRRS
jgi:DNA-binding transcriptional regulator PaaX